MLESKYFRFHEVLMAQTSYPTKVSTIDNLYFSYLVLYNVQ